MKRYSLLVAIIITAVIGASSFAQDKASLQPNATIASLLQGSAGKSVELHVQCGEKIGGKVAQVTTISFIFPISPARNISMVSLM